MTKYLKFPFLIIFLSLTYFFYFDKLGYENTNEDQFRWYDRTNNFFSAISNKNFAGTYQQYHPGIFLIYLLKAGIESFKISSGVNFVNFREIAPELFPILNFHTKLYVVVFVLFSIFLATYMMHEKYGKFISLNFLILLTFDTYFIGLTRNLHMDSVLALCVFVSLFSFYRLLETKNLTYLLIATLYTGLGLLTKSVFGLALVFHLFITIYFFINNREKLIYIKYFFANLVISILIFAALFPSMWVSPIETLSKIYLKGALSTGLGGDDNFTHYINGYALPDPGPKFYLHIINFRFSAMVYLTIVLITILGLYQTFKTGKINLKIEPQIIFFIVFSLVYLAIITYSTKKTDRYISLLYPSIVLIISYYLKLTWISIKNIFIKFLFAGFVAITIIINYLIHPFYFAHYNPIFGGINEAQKRIYINQGGNAYLSLINELEKIPVRKISAINYEEIAYASKKPVYPLNYYNFEEPNFIKVVPLQRGDNLIKNSKLIKTINILNQPYWKIYE